MTHDRQNEHQVPRLGDYKTVLLHTVEEISNKNGTIIVRGGICH